MTSTKPWYQYYHKHLEVDETGAAKTYWKDNISSGPRRCITIHLAKIWGHIKQKKGSSNYLRLYHQYIGTCKMINMLRKGIKFSIQRVYFPHSYFESRHYGKRLNSIGKFKSLTFQLRAIYFHTFAVDMSVYYWYCNALQSTGSNVPTFMHHNLCCYKNQIANMSTYSYPPPNLLSIALSKMGWHFIYLKLYYR